MCTVPLSLQTHSSCSSGRNATPYISALSVPLLNSLTSFPVIESHIRTKVPRIEVVARSLPDVGSDKVVRAEVCAAMIETGCFEGGGGGFRGRIEAGGSLETGGGQGGRWINWTWPICRPGIASRVEYGAVAIASKPKSETIFQSSRKEIQMEYVILTSWVIGRVPFAISRHGFTNLEHDDSPS